MKVKKKTKRNDEVVVARNGVFPELISSMAMIDKMVVSVTGQRLKRVGPNVELGDNRAVGGKKSFYARCVHGRCKPTGNPFQFLYGKQVKFPNVPDMRLTLRSEQRPLSASEAFLVLHSLFGRSVRAVVASLEVTFDLKDFRFERLARQLLSRARRRRELCDATGRRTLYLGGPRSDWQLRVYSKRVGVLRCEVILRRPFLKVRKIAHVEDVLLVKQVNLWKLIWLRSFDDRALRACLRRVNNSRVANLWAESVCITPTTDLLTELRDYFHVDGLPLLRVAAAERVMRRMQQNLVW